MLKLKTDVLQLLQQRGYNTYRIKIDNLLSQSTLTKLRAGTVPVGSLDTLCRLTGLQPGDLIEYIPDNE